MKEAPKPLAHLFVRQEFASFQRRLATLYSLDETVFLCEIARHNVLYNLTWIAAVFIRQLPETRMEIGIEVDFHTLTIR